MAFDADPADLHRDILIKSAEGIQEGMWCRGEWFKSGLVLLDNDSYYHPSVDLQFWEESGVLTPKDRQMLLSEIASSPRCVEGEIALQTKQLGGGARDFHILQSAIAGHLRKVCPTPSTIGDGPPSCWPVRHNDDCMTGLDAFEAGQQWSEILRAVADGYLD